MWQIMSLEPNSRLGVAFKGCPGVDLCLSACVSWFPFLSPEGACVSHMWVGRAGLERALARAVWPSASSQPGAGMKTEGFSQYPGQPMFKEYCRLKKSNTFPFTRPASAPHACQGRLRGEQVGHVMSVLTEPAAAPTQPPPLQAQGGCDSEDAGFSACNPLSGVLGGSTALCTSQPPGECEQQRDPHLQRTEAEGRFPPTWFLG